MASGDYLLDNQRTEAGERFDALPTLFNASTFRHMNAIGLTTGWRPWEDGAGGPSVPAWIAARTGVPVLATDIDTDWLNDMDESVDNSNRWSDLRKVPEIPSGVDLSFYCSSALVTMLISDGGVTRSITTRSHPTHRAASRRANAI